MRTDTTPPEIASLTSGPLRNRIRVELTAPTADVWSLVGDLARYPEYSAGLAAVHPVVDAGGICTEYTCHFRPMDGSSEGIVHREIVRWYEPGAGYASIAEENNAFGLKGSVTLVTVEPSRDGTTLTWSQYYDAKHLEVMKAEFAAALDDIGENLARRFGGRVAARYVEEQD